MLEEHASRPAAVKMADAAPKGYPPPHEEGLVLSYLGLRTAIGIIGISLPFVLVFGKMLLEGPGIEHSISAYYYTAMRDVFVGSLCAIAVFMASYRGYDWRDDVLGDLACVFALGVAFFPTAPKAAATARQEFIGVLHYVCAGGLFSVLAIFCLYLFTQSGARGKTRQKVKRNRVYVACGWTIAACIVLSIVAGLLPGDAPVKRLAPVFWLEAIAIFAFGVSWFVKGEAILGDDEPAATRAATA